MEKITKRLLLAFAAVTIFFAAFGLGHFISNRRTADTYSVTTELGGAMLLDYTEAAQVLLPAAKVNLNTAESEELQTLEGIGPALAQRIIDYRAEIGGFTHTYELMDVRGIGEKLYERIKDRVTVESDE